MSKKIEIKDLNGYRYPENLQYSPDGKYLAFQVASADVKKNDYHRDVWLSENGSAAQFTETVNTTLTGWDDNEHMILQRHTEEDEAGTTVLYRMNVKGGEAKKWLTLPFPAVSFEKVKKDLYYAVGIIKRDDPDAYKDNEETRKKKQEEEKQNKDYQVVDEVPYWFNGSNYTNGQRTALFLISTDKDVKVKRVTGSSFDTGTVKVFGDDIYYTGLAWKLYNPFTAKLYVYHTKTGKTETLFNKKGWNIGNILMLKGKLYVLATDMKEYGTNESNHFCLVTKDGFEMVKDPERSLYNGVAVDTELGGGKNDAQSGDCYYTLATQEDHTEIWKYDSALKQSVLFTQPGSVFFLDVSKDKIAFACETSDSLMEVYEMDHTGKQVKKITSLNTEALKDKYVAKPKRIDYKSNGDSLHGWVLLPQGFSKKKKYPGVFDIHGGPRAVYSEAFFHEMQVWCAEGYAVFFTNIRGSDGRGDAFADVRDQYGNVDYAELMDFTDAVLKKYPNIDKKKLCETGGSYGGFMTNWIIGHTDRFCCAASQRSIASWISEAFISDIGVMFSADQCGAKNVYRDTQKLWDHSPLKYAENVKTPTLFIHSDQDRRCPLPEGMQMMQAIAGRNVETRMVIFHGENHELSRSGKPLHRIKRLEEITGWFNKHTK
jgi:dipeptidyl aminopeptidase/acylaminoacyl peptidase